MKNSKGGYAGRALRINLSTGKQTTVPLDKELQREYIGGRGFTSKLQFDLVGRETNPLGPDNILVFATGPLTGTLAPSGARFVIGAKSPQTGILGDANCGGHWGAELKFAGYDLVVITGKAKNPVYIWISNDEVKIQDAQATWGKDVYETDQLLKEETDKEARVAAIGQAGENLVKYANIMAERCNAAGRTGVGAVMGSKKLKAIAVRGTNDIEIADPDEFFKNVEDIRQILNDDFVSSTLAPQYGTTMYISSVSEMGAMSTRNWQTGVFDEIEKVNGETIRGKLLIKARSCYACPTRCRRVIQVREGPFAGTYLGKVDYYPIMNFSAKCGNSNLGAVMKSCELCDRYGLDIGSAGQCIAFAMECYEKGLINQQDTDGIPLDWGNYESIHKLIENIAFRKGFGALLAEGERGASERIKGSERFAIHVKGMSFATVDPRVGARHEYAFGYTIASRAGDHLRVFAVDLPTKMAFAHPVEKVILAENACTSVDMMGVCKLTYNGYSCSLEMVKAKAFDGVAKLYTSSTGIELNTTQLVTIAERVINTEKLFNLRMGMTRTGDAMPARFAEEPLPEGPGKGQLYNVQEEYLDKYYSLRQWDKKTGIPSKEKLAELGIDEKVPC